MHDHLLRVNAQVDQFRDLLSTALGANLTQVNVRQNEDMRRITAWVAIAAVPTAVAGIYGMNFDHMPELAWKFGYPLVLDVDRVDLPVPVLALPPSRLVVRFENPVCRRSACGQGNNDHAACASDRTHAAHPMKRIFLCRKIRCVSAHSLDRGVQLGSASSATFVSHSQKTSTIGP